jgi:hypothetical protein
MANPQKSPRYVLTTLPLGANKKISVYAGKQIREALLEVSSNMTIWKGVRLSQVLEAFYIQGKKDGARSVFDKVDGLKGLISYRNPGAPQKKKKRVGKKSKKR